MTFDVNHIGMQQGIYLARKDILATLPRESNPSELYNLIVVTYDIRLRKPYQDELLTINQLHTLEHVLSIALRQIDYQDGSNKFIPDSTVHCIYEGAMACQTGLYFIFTGPESKALDVYEICKRIELAMDYAMNMKEVPAKEQARCGNYTTLLTIEEIKPELKLIQDLALGCLIDGKLNQYRYI